MSENLPASVVASIAFIGRTGGAVKTLGGYRKGRHTLPDAANAFTHAFLGRICAEELTDEAERLFQDVRTGMRYKRTEVALNVSGPGAVLTAKDFTVEIDYALEERDPARYVVTTTMRELRDIAVTRLDAMRRIFAGKFSEISFELSKGASVEAIIDAIEALNDEVMSVDYPSDYRDCTIRVAGVPAEVRCTGSALAIVFPRGAAPAELVDAFVAVREAFQISKALRALIA